MDRKKRDGRNRAVFSFLKSAAASGARFPAWDDLSSDVPGEKGRRRADFAGRRNPGRWAVLPILGSIPAGFGDPVESVELGSIPVDLEALNIKPASRTFALKVRGDSMSGAHIADGDLVIVEAREPKVGEVVAALIDGETTLKRFVAEGDGFFLKAENPKYPDLIPLRDLTVQGVVRAVVRICDRSGRAA